MTGSRPKIFVSVTNHGPSVNHALDLRSLELFWIAWRLIDITVWIGWALSVPLNLRKISDCRSFSDFKTLTACRSFSHSDKVYPTFTLQKRKHKRGIQVMWHVMFKIAKKAHRSSNPGSNPGSNLGWNPSSKFRYPPSRSRFNILNFPSGLPHNVRSVVHRQLLVYVFPWKVTCSYCPWTQIYRIL